MEYYSIKDSDWFWGLGWKRMVEWNTITLRLFAGKSYRFIIAVLAEEFGFLGVFLLLLIYSLIIIRGAL